MLFVSDISFRDNLAKAITRRYYYFYRVASIIVK